MARAKLDDSPNGVATKVHPALAAAREWTARKQGGAAPAVPQSDLPAFAKDKAAPKKGKDKADKKASPKAPAGKPAKKAEPAKARGPAEKVPTKAELLEALGALRGLRDAVKAAGPAVRKMLAEAWPNVDDEAEAHYHDQARNLVDAEYEVAAASTIDMSVDGAMLEDIEALIESLEGKGPAGAWVAAVMATPAARPSARRPKAIEPSPEPDDVPDEEYEQEAAEEASANLDDGPDDDDDEDADGEQEFAEEDDEDEDDFLDDEADDL